MELPLHLLPVPVAAGALLTYSRTRAFGYFVEKQLLETAARFLGQGAPPPLLQQPRLLLRLRKDIDDLLKQDCRNIAEGVYPPSVLIPEGPRTHGFRLIRIIGDGLGIAQRRKSGRTTQFSRAAKALLAELPRYYRRTFHFQTDGYLSRHSAELYDHQVEILFSGAADAMRRLVLRPLKEAFPRQAEGEGLRILEIGAGTGRTTGFVARMLPRAKVVAVDLSHAYLGHARHALEGLDRVDFVQGDGAALPFKDGSFDAVVSTFVFHELPRKERARVLKEARRVLRRGGFLGVVDSVQLKDRPDLKDALRQFPADFHEPYYRDYVEHPLEAAFNAAGFSRPKKSLGFLSKCLWAKAR